jgi:tRNA (adenine57-N1/adenine58-N1)-methyltransferase
MRRLETDRGVLSHDDLIGQPIGSEVRTHLGYAYYLLLPTTEEIVKNLPRESQIIFPKDAGYIMMKLGIAPGSRVVEAGTGSGGLCLALATAVGPEGHVFSYDVRNDMQLLARRNLERAGLNNRVTLTRQDAQAGFAETEVDAVFLDLLIPHHLLEQSRAALRGGGVLGCLVPTANQVIDLLKALASHPGYTFVEVEELILRAYKAVAARLRPEDHMIGHTGYLVFARAVIPSSDTDSGAQPPATTAA